MSKLTRLLKLLLETDEAWPPPTAVNFIGRSTPRGRHGAGREVSRRGLRRLDALLFHMPWRLPAPAGAAGCAGAPVEGAWPL